MSCFIYYYIWKWIPVIAHRSWRLYRKVKMWSRHVLLITYRLEEKTEIVLCIYKRALYSVLLYISLAERKNWSLLCAFRSFHKKYSTWQIFYLQFCGSFQYFLFYQKIPTRTPDRKHVDLVSRFPRGRKR